MTRDRPALRLVESASTQEIEWSWFCGRCAAPAPSGAAPAPSSRVCPSCGFGILLESRADSIPSNKDAFLVIDSSLLVQGVSPASRVPAGRRGGVGGQPARPGAVGPRRRRGSGAVAICLCGRRGDGWRGLRRNLRSAVEHVRRPHAGEDRYHAGPRELRCSSSRAARRVSAPSNAAGYSSPGAGGRTSGAPYLTRTSGKTTEPSSRCPFSSSAMIVRPVTAVPLSVCTNAGFPSASR